MKPINVAVIGTGWCGGIRAETCAAYPLVQDLHVAETRPERLAEIAAKTRAKTATADYRELLKIDDIDAVLISATPETTHYPMARESLLAGKHVFLEKPIALDAQARSDHNARRGKISSRSATRALNSKYAYVSDVSRTGRS